MKSIYKHETEIAKNGSAIPIFENEKKSENYNIFSANA